MTTRRWVDWVNVILGAWLIVSAWVVVLHATEGAIAWNAWSAGGAIVTLAAFSMYKPCVGADALGIIIGIWLVASPWIFGLRELSSAATNAVIVGLLVIGYALWALRIDARTSSVPAPMRNAVPAP